LYARDSVTITHNIGGVGKQHDALVELKAQENLSHHQQYADAYIKTPSTIIPLLKDGYGSTANSATNHQEQAREQHKPMQMVSDEFPRRSLSQT
jgi:hypothetical protein